MSKLRAELKAELRKKLRAKLQVRLQVQPQAKSPTQSPSKAVGKDESSGLSGMLQRIFTLAPGTHANNTCSVMQVETLFRERLAARSGEDRILGQLECYVRLAENLLSSG